ncbi:MAG: class I SAM-dependent methyltransferase [Gallionellaceae bacterium]|nr:class I SAM-dependent methyltransferase [Gallionellaceae bacterium]
MQREKAQFVERASCITCGSANIIQIASGRFNDDPLRSFIENDPWGESPIPYIADGHWVFVGCGDCTTRFHQRILAPEWVQRCYSEWVTQEAMEKFLAPQNTPQTHFNKARQHVSHVLRLEKLTRQIREGDTVRVLDFGCGWGEFLVMCARFGLNGYGIDFAPDRRKQGQVSIFSGIEDLQNGTPNRGMGFFHAITMFEVLEHLADPLAVLQSLNDLIMPGGVLILETPDCTGVQGIQTIQDYRAIHPLSHINSFTPKSLRTIAGYAGFSPINCGVAQVTCDLAKVIKTEAKRALSKLLKPATQQYFRKT